MATFTDNPNSFLSHTAGYVSQMPIIQSELQADAIMTERQNQGIQKVRDTVTGIMSLPLARQVDQQYLKQQLSGLQQQFTNMSGDFADSRFQQTIGGAITSLSSDTRIQNGIQQTIAMQNDGAQAQADLKAGKGKASNQWVYQNAASNYINSTDPNATYNKSYYTPVDTLGKFNDLLKSVGDDKQVTSLPFSYDANGNPTGVADAMEKITREGHDPAKLQQAFDLLMQDPDVINQTRIDGAYNYRGLDTNGVVNMLNSRIQSLDAARQQQIENVKTGKLVSNIPNGSDAKAKIDAINQNYNNAVNNLRGVSQLALNDTDGAKTLLQEQSMRESMIGVYGYSWSHPSIEYSDNPLFKALMDKKNFQLNVRKEDFDEKQALDASQRGWAGIDIDRQRLALSQQEFQAKMDGRLRTNADGSTSSASGGLGSDIVTTGGLPDSEGQKGAEYLNSLENDANSNVRNTIITTANRLQQQKNQPPFFLPDANGGWQANLAEYKSYANIQQQMRQVTGSAAAAYRDGHASNVGYSFGQDLSNSIRYQQTVQNVKSKINSQVKAQLDYATNDPELKRILAGSKINATIVDPNKPRANSRDPYNFTSVSASSDDVINLAIYKFGTDKMRDYAEKQLVGKFGQIPTEFTGVDQSKVMNSVRKNVSKYANVSSAITGIYQENLRAISPNVCSLNFKQSDEPLVQRSILAGSTSLDVAGGNKDIAAFNEIVNGSGKSTDAPLNVSYTTPPSGTGNGTVTVTRGEKTKTISMPISTMRASIPNYQGVTQFQSKYGPELRINGDMTDVNNPYTQRAGNYEIKYSVIGDGNGGYMHVGSIYNTKTGKKLTDNIQLDTYQGSYQSESSFMESENQLQNEQTIKLLLQANGITE